MVVSGVLFAAVILKGSGTFPVGAIRNAPIAAFVVQEPQLHLPFEGQTPRTCSGQPPGFH